MTGPRRVRLSLRTRLLLSGLSLATLLLLAAGLVLALQRQQGQLLSEAVGSLAEEQALADRMAQAVTRQLVLLMVPAPASPEGSPPPPINAQARQVEDEAAAVRTLLRAILDRPRSLEERVLVERLREAHQRVETAAARVLLHDRMGDTGASLEARRATGQHVEGFMEELERFMDHRAREFDALQEQQARFGRTLSGGYLGLALGSFILLLLWVRRFHRRLSSPLGDLLAAADRVASGDLATRVPREHDPEFDRVAEGFNRMASALEDVRRELRHRNVELEGALDTLRRAQGELVQSEKMAALGRLAAGLAHELNNPLGSVVGFAELLASHLDERGSAEARALRAEFVDPILGESARARDLIVTILGFSRRSEAEAAPEEVRAALDAVRRLREPAFRSAGLALEVGEVGDVFVRCDRHLLQSMILNLVGNARDALAPLGRGTLRIRDASTHDRVVLHFEDDGPGFPDVERAFEPFYTTKEPGEGTGLGLSLVHRFAVESGGRVVAENRSEGGARVTIELPRSPKPEPAPEPGPAPIPDPAPGPVPGPAPGPSPPRGVVLVVDDEPSLRTLQGRILRRMGLTAVEAGSVSEARLRLKEGGVDAVVSDVRMPGETGLDLLHWVREHHPELEERFVLVTGDLSHPEVNVVAHSIPGGALLKPFSNDEYRTRIARLLPPTAAP